MMWKLLDGFCKFFFDVVNVDNSYGQNVKLYYCINRCVFYRYAHNAWESFCIKIEMNGLRKE